MKEVRRLSRVNIEGQVNDSSDRTILPMSTLVSIDEDPPCYTWLLETTWDGSQIGDVQIFRNRNVSHDEVRKKDSEGNVLEPDWYWWGGVPNGRIKTYKFAASEAATITPQSVAVTFNINAERKEEPRQATKGVGSARA